MVDYQLYGRNKVVFDVKLSYFDISAIVSASVKESSPFDAEGLIRVFIETRFNGDHAESICGI